MEGLQIIADADCYVEVIAHANRILSKAGVFVGVGMGVGRAEILDIVFRHAMSVGPKGRQLKAAFLGDERKRIDFDFVKNIFASGEGGEEVVDFGNERISAEFERVACFLQVQGLGEVEPIFIRATRQNGGSAEALEDGRNSCQGVGGIGYGSLQVS